MTQDTMHSLAIGLFSEVIAADQAIRNRLGKVLPKGMELSHFSVLNHLARAGGERSPAQLAETFNVTRGAMTNTLNRLEWAGYVHIRPDWDDARRKMVALSPAGRRARDRKGAPCPRKALRLKKLAADSMLRSKSTMLLLSSLMWSPVEEIS